MYKMMIILLCSFLLLSACGKRGGLEAPPGSDPKYPRSYPQQ